MSGEPIRVIVADDQALFRSGLVRLLAEDPRLEIVGEAKDGQEAVELTARLEPDVVLLDMRMPQMDGIEATQRIMAAQPEVKVIALTAFETDNLVVQALKAGAAAYVLKDADKDAVVSTILAVRSGERVMASAVAKRVIDMLTGHGPTRAYYDNLTPREIEILTMLAKGFANKQIAYRAKISEKTVRNHISNIYEKLNVEDRSHAVLYAVRKGLVEV